ncbi:DUF6236 family protein [Pseudomonas sp. RL_105y_Pfl1_103]|uniref:DUF6236 family protein n=1 Tax=Pseudomonas sp. RL_105y_Pfl1_103 TaxID=3088707 RepID=UPI0030DB3317
MGESKFIKAHNSNYENTKKPSPARGLIINNPMYLNSDSFGSNNPQLMGQELRATLLYWDRIALPLNNIIRVEPSKDVRYLESAGILKLHEIRVSGDMKEGLRKIPGEVLRHYESRQPGAWSLGSGENSILVMDGSAEKDEGTLIQLYNAIPIPAEDVPLNEVLEFKQRRRPELLAIRNHLDNLAVEINNSSDSPEKLKGALQNIDSTCSDLAKVCREWQTPFYMSNLKVSLNFNIAKAIKDGSAVWNAFESYQLGMTAKVAGAAFAAVQSQIEFKPDIRLRSIKRPVSPFRYIYEAKQLLC